MRTRESKCVSFTVVQTSGVFVNIDDEISSAAVIYDVTKTRRYVNAGHVAITITKCIVKYC